MHQFIHKIRDWGDSHHVMKGFHQGGLKHTHQLMYALILGNLEFVKEPLLTDPHILYLNPICKDGDDECVVYLLPLEEVEASDQVAKDADSMYGGFCVV